MPDVLENIRVFPFRTNTLAEDSDDTLSHNSHVGVEIEAENVGMDRLNRILERDNINYSRYWRLTFDGSLRGFGVEALFSRPLSGGNIYHALTMMDDALSQLQPDFNDRTSVHVHVSALDMTREQIARMIHCYMVFEEAIFDYVGVSRANNNYCLPLCGDYVTGDLLKTLAHRDYFLRFAHSDDMGMLMRDRACKYSALNVKTLPTLGTLEFRHHGGTCNKDRIMEWINIILCMKRWAVSNEHTIMDIVSAVSSDSGIGLAHDVFGEWGNSLNIQPGGIYRGVRSLQEAILPNRIELEETEEDLATSIIQNMGGDPIEKFIEKVKTRCEYVLNYDTTSDTKLKLLNDLDYLHMEGHLTHELEDYLRKISDAINPQPVFEDIQLGA